MIALILMLLCAAPAQAADWEPTTPKAKRALKAFERLTDKGEGQKADEQLKACAAAESAPGRCTWMLGDLRILQGRWTEAEDLLTSLARAHPDRVEGRVSLTTLWVRLGRTDMALDVAAEAVKRAPADGLAVASLLFAEDAAGRDQEADELWGSVEPALSPADRDCMLAYRAVYRGGAEELGAAGGRLAACAETTIPGLAWFARRAAEIAGATMTGISVPPGLGPPAEALSRALAVSRRGDYVAGHAAIDRADELGAPRELLPLFRATVFGRGGELERAQSERMLWRDAARWLFEQQVEGTYTFRDAVAIQDLLGLARFYAAAGVVDAADAGRIAEAEELLAAARLALGDASVFFSAEACIHLSAGRGDAAWSAALESPEGARIEGLRVVVLQRLRDQSEHPPSVEHIERVSVASHPTVRFLVGQGPMGPGLYRAHLDLLAPLTGPVASAEERMRRIRLEGQTDEQNQRTVNLSALVSAIRAEDPDLTIRFWTLQAPFVETHPKLAYWTASGLLMAERFEDAWAVLAASQAFARAEDPELRRGLLDHSLEAATATGRLDAILSLALEPAGHHFHRMRAGEVLAEGGRVPDALKVFRAVCKTAEPKLQTLCKDAIAFYSE